MTVSTRWVADRQTDTTDPFHLRREVLDPIQDDIGTGGGGGSLTAQTVGDISPAATKAQTTGGYIYGRPLTLPAAGGTIDVARFWLSGDGPNPGGPGSQQPLAVLLYTDNGGAPDTLIARSAVVNYAFGTAAGFQAFNFSSAILIPSNKVWVMLETGFPQQVANTYRSAGAMGASYFVAETFGSPPTTFTGGTADTAMDTLNVDWAPGTGIQGITTQDGGVVVGSAGVIDTLDFGDGLDVTVAGTTATVDATATGTGTGSGLSTTLETTAPLLAGATYATDPIDCAGGRFLGVRTTADQTGTLSVYDSTDASTWRLVWQAPAAALYASVAVPVFRAYAQVRYLNGATNQATFEMVISS
jgi:hypothetical protein